MQTPSSQVSSLPHHFSNTSLPPTHFMSLYRLYSSLYSHTVSPSVHVGVGVGVGAVTENDFVLSWMCISSHRLPTMLQMMSYVPSPSSGTHEFVSVKLYLFELPFGKDDKLMKVYGSLSLPMFFIGPLLWLYTMQ